MSIRPFTHAEATAELRHISEYLPARFKRGEHFDLAMNHARQVARATGQAKFQNTKLCCQHMLEGLK